MSEPAWITQNEIDFVNGLGQKWTCLKDNPTVARRSVKACLADYLESAKLRVDWSGINRGEVIDHAQKMFRAVRDV